MIMRLKLAGHCARHPEEAGFNLVLWVPDRGDRGRGRPTGTFIDTLMRDTGLQLEEMHACMQDKGQVEDRCSLSWNEFDIVIVVVVLSMIIDMSDCGLCH